MFKRINFLFLFLLVLIGSNLYGENITRDTILDISYEYVKGIINPNTYGEKWSPQIVEATNEDTANSVIFKSYFTKDGMLFKKESTCEKFKYVVAKEGSYTIGRATGNTSEYWIIPYCLGGYENPEILQDRIEAGENDRIEVPGTDIKISADYIKTGPTAPGGFTTRRIGVNGNATGIASSIFKKKNHRYNSTHNQGWGQGIYYSRNRKYISGIDCIGFVSKCLGFQHQIGRGMKPPRTTTLSLYNADFPQSIHSVAIMKDGNYNYDKLKHGDFVINTGTSHIRLFLNIEIVNNEKVYKMREAAPPFVRDIGYTREILKTTGYKSFTVFPNFRLSKIPKVYIASDAPTSFTMTVEAGREVGDLTMRDVTGNNDIEGFSYANYSQSLSGRITGASASYPYRHHKAEKVNIPIVYSDAGVPGLQKAEFEVSAANKFSQKGYVFYNFGHSGAVNYKYNDTTNFTFYKYSGAMPSIAKAVVITDENNKVIASYYFSKANGSWKLEEKNVFDIDIKDKGTFKKIRVYVGYTEEMTKGSLTFIKTSDFESLKINNHLVSTFLRVVSGNTRYAFQTFDKRKKIDFLLQNFNNSSVLNEIIGKVEDIPNEAKNLNWMYKEQTVSVNDLLEMQIIAVKGKMRVSFGNVDSIDSNPLTEATVDIAKSGALGITFANYEDSTPMYLRLFFDKDKPVLTHIKILSERGNLGEWKNSDINNGRDGVVSTFKDIGDNDVKKGLTIKLQADDDAELMGKNTYIYLIPSNKKDDFYTARQTYLTACNNASDDDDPKGARIKVFDDYRVAVKAIIGSKEVITAGKDTEYHGWNPQDPGIRSDTRLWNWSSGKIVLNNPAEKSYKLALLMTDASFKPISVLSGAGGVTKNTNEEYAYYADPPQTNTNDVLYDGCFLSPDFNVDITVPTFSFSAGALFDDFLAGMKKALMMSFSDNLSRDLNVDLTLKKKDGGEEIIGMAFKISGIQELVKDVNDLSRDLSQVTVKMTKDFGVKLDFNIGTGQFDLQINLQQLMASEALLQEGLNGIFSINIADNAGNEYMDAFKEINVGEMIIDQALQALMQGLGISDKSLIVSPGFSAGGVEIDPAKYLLVGMGVNGKTVPIFPSDEAYEIKTQGNQNSKFSYQDSKFKIIENILNDYKEWNLNKCKERKEKEVEKILNYIFHTS